MIEYLNESNSDDFDKIFNKSLKKNEFKDISKAEIEKCILLCKEGSNYVGFLEGCICENNLIEQKIGNIVALYVLPGYRNEGKAHSMIMEFEKWLKDRDCTNMIVNMPIKNKKSLDFFEKVAFRNIGTCVLMTKSI